MNVRRFGKSVVIALVVMGIVAIAGMGAGHQVVQASGSDEQTTRPASPSSLVASSTDEGVALTWDAPDGEVTSYQILRRRPQECEPRLKVHVADTGSEATEYVDTDTMPGVRYVYRVKAINENGVGSRSNFANITYTPSSSIPASGSPASRRT